MKSSWFSKNKEERVRIPKYVFPNPNAPLAVEAQAKRARRAARNLANLAKKPDPTLL